MGGLCGLMSRLALYGRDSRRIRRLAVEIEQQAGYFERNVAIGGEAEALRFLLLERLATDVLKVARRGRRRYWKARGGV